MGMLMSFLGGAAKSLQGSIEQDRFEQKRIEDEKRQHDQQVSWAKAAEALRINTATKTALPAETPLGAPIKDASGNWVQPTQIASGALVDDELNVTRPAAMMPGRSIPTTDPYALKPYEAAKLEDNKLNRESREKAARIRASGGGSGNGGADRRADESNSRRDRDGLEQATERRLADVRAELKGLSRDVDEETGFSPFDDALQRRGLPMGLNYTDAIELERKRINDELAPEYGGSQGGGKAAPKGDAKSKNDPTPYKEGETIYDRNGRKHIVKNGVPVPV